MDVLCPWEAPTFLIFSSNVPTLLYYSHAIAMLAAALFGFALIPKLAESRPARWFLSCIVFFLMWAIVDVLVWATNRPDAVLFYWNLQVLLEILLFSSAFYFAYVFITGRDLRFWKQCLLALLMLPVIVLLPTAHVLTGVDASSCNATETNFLIYYVYAFQILLPLILLFVFFREMRNSPARRGELILFTFGILIFLLAFSSGNIIGSITEDWALAQAGLFGMPVFIGLLAYTAVKFKTFNLKLFGAQALVVALWLLTLSQLFIRTIENIRIVVVLNLVLFTILGYFLVRSVKNEIHQRERVEQLAKDLELANERLKDLDQMKSEFLSVASHQLRAPITAVRGYAANIIEGEYGKVPANLKEPLDTVQESARLMANSIEDYLNISRIEQGRMKYEKSTFDLADLAKKVVNELAPIAAKKKLGLTADSPEDLMVTADIGKIKQVITNLTDNAIKYTKEGSVTVKVESASGKARLTVQDTGIGIPAEELPQLFEKFKRARGANKVNTTGTGLGLYVAKQLIEGHGGKVWAESDGAGKGTRFIFELPL